MTSIRPHAPVRRPSWRSLILPLCALLVAAGAALAQDVRRPVLMVEIEGGIGPASARHLETALETARERDAEILLMRINTPGGLASSMRDMIASILAAEVPVVGYVAPPGAHAASAGTYIMYATHVAAMAPGTNLGAATPVQIGGGGLPGMPGQEEEEENGDESEEGEEAGDEEQSEEQQPSDAMSAKAINDAVAFIQSLAELRDRNAEWAERAVRQAESLSADAAREQDVIEIVAKDMQDLLEQLDGRTVTIRDVERTLHTRDVEVELIEPTVMTRVLGVLSNPNIAFILMLVGIYGLIFELANPGTVGPGVVGGICLILALYALNQLPLNYAGLALLAFGIILMVAEAFTPTFGILGLGGMVAFIFGAAMLIDTDIPAFQIDWSVILATSVMSGALLALLLGYIYRSHRLKVVSGEEAIHGASARVLDWSGQEGHVWMQGERWRARGDGRFRKGQTVRVQRTDGLTLTVEPMQREAAETNPEN